MVKISGLQRRVIEGSMKAMTFSVKNIFLRWVIVKVTYIKGRYTSLFHINIECNYRAVVVILW